MDFSAISLWRKSRNITNKNTSFVTAGLIVTCTNHGLGGGGPRFWTAQAEKGHVNR